MNKNRHYDKCSYLFYPLSKFQIFLQRNILSLLTINLQT